MSQRSEDAILGLAMALAITALVVAILVASTGCGGKPEPVEPRVVFTATPCLTAAESPPELPGADAVAGPDEGCADERGCVTAKLYLWVASMISWSEMAWTKCGPPATPATGETP